MARGSARAPPEGCNDEFICASQDGAQCESSNVIIDVINWFPADWTITGYFQNDIG